jgi:hypothetical protein
LRGALAAGASSVGEVRIVSVSSSGHQLSPVIFDDLHFLKHCSCLAGLWLQATD